MKEKLSFLKFTKNEKRFIIVSILVIVILAAVSKAHAQYTDSSSMGETHTALWQPVTRTITYSLIDVSLLIFLAGIGVSAFYITKRVKFGQQKIIEVK